MAKNHSNSKDNQELYPGIRVKIAQMRNTGEIIEGPNRKDQFCVMIGALSMWIERKALTAVATSKAKPSLKQSKLLGMHQTIEDLSVDFHGMTVSEAIEAAESALNSALLKNANRIELIHGIGSGKLKTALQGYMNNSPHVQRCEIDPNNPGTSWAYLGSKA